MSWSNRFRAGVFLALTLATAAALGGCSFSPVYGGRLAEQPSLNLAYAEPTSRLDQIIYQELAFRLGSSSLSTAPLVRVRASSSLGDIALSASVNPNIPREVTVTATLAIQRRDGVEEEPLTITRFATAQLTRNGQVLADQEAVIDANERAARAVAESLRLALLAHLAKE